MILSLPLKPSQHPRGPQQTSRSITALLWSSTNHYCHHNQPVGCKHMHVASTASLWSPDSPFRYPSRPGGPQTCNIHHSHLMILRIPHSSWWFSDSANRYHSYPNIQKSLPINIAFTVVVHRNIKYCRFRNFCVIFISGFFFFISELFANS